MCNYLFQFITQFRKKVLSHERGNLHVYKHSLSLNELNFIPPHPTFSFKQQQQQNHVLQR